MHYCTPPNLKQIRYNVLASLSTFFADKHFHIGTLDDGRAVERRGIRFSGQGAYECLVIAAETFEKLS